MEPGASSEQDLPEHDFDPDKLDLRVRVTLAADRHAVEPEVGTGDANHSRDSLR